MLKNLSNKRACNMPNSMSKNYLFCYFASFLIVLGIAFIKKLKYSRDLTILIMSSVSSFEIINAVVSNPIFVVADAVAVNPKSYQNALN